MGRKRHKAEEIIAKLRQAEVLSGQGQSAAEAIRWKGITEVTYYRWRSECGRLKGDQVKRLCAHVAEAMAQGAIAASTARLAAAITGVAGPEPDEDNNPVGLVFCSVARDDGYIQTERHVFPNTAAPDAVVRHAIDCSLNLLLRACE